MSPLRVGVIGVGHLGREHARIYASLPGCVLAGVVDTHEGRGKEIAVRHGVPLFARPEDLFGKVDAVSVVVPTRAHFAVAKPFLERGIPCLVEKPITATVEEAEAMVALAKSSGAILQIGHVERFNPAVQAYFRAPRIIPRFIEAQRISPYPFRSTDVGVVLDLMIHDLDIVLHLANSPVQSIEALGLNVLSRTEDLANARIRFENGCVADLTASRVALKTLRQVRLFSAEAYLVIDYRRQEARFYRKSERLLRGEVKVEDVPRESVKDARAFVFGELLNVETLRVPRVEPLASELESFIECVRDRKAPLVPGEHGLRALRAAVEIQRQIRACLSPPPAPKAGQ
ncbi:MAG: Gfo/Idh/MocA family oxidoreductase [Planctomycetota bacterium]